MKVLLVTNKTLSNGKDEWLDGGHWNLYLPLKKMGHDVYFYDTRLGPVGSDTVRGDARDFSKIVDNFKPELIFCCMTGDPSLTPNEPWDELTKQTQKGNCKTFNWFCDDTWRFESFSKHVCKHFHVCSTPEIHYIDRFKEIGYNNIILGFWHSNIDFYPKGFAKKNDISFCGQLNMDRKHFINYLTEGGIDVKNYYGLSTQEMLQSIADSRIGINFSKNHNGRPAALQMKGRMVEVPAAKSLLLTEYAPGLEEHFVIDKEVITFRSADEMYKKAKFLLKHPGLVKKITDSGHKRFLRDHESTVRLTDIINKIIEL